MNSQQAGRMMKATKIPMMSGMDTMHDQMHPKKKTAGKKKAKKAKK